ncbi:MAG: DKNYY domain-containing protein [Sebaldella sp.]|nr:DKNYY domain-containing protein [Sebaldella sp.]
MKNSILLFFLISFSLFPCRTIINPKNPYVIKNNKVYYKDVENEEMLLNNANSKEFENISYSKETCEYRDYGKDKRNVYFKNIKIKGADSKSFTVLKQGYYKDKRYIYFKGKRLEGSDSREKIEFIEGTRENSCVPWGDGGCIINNGNKYKNSSKEYTHS